VTFQVTAIVLLCLILVVSCIAPIVFYRRLTARFRREVSQFVSRLDKNLGAAAKLLEVRDYYQKMSAELKRMLDEAYKEGDRVRQDRLRKLIERLETLKARTLDKTVSILNSSEGRVIRKRRRRSRPRRKPKPKPPADKASA